jgi:hypothetical protein
MAERRAVTAEIAIATIAPISRGKRKTWGELCTRTVWDRNRARKALRAALIPKVLCPRTGRDRRTGRTSVRVDFLLGGAGKAKGFGRSCA